MSPIDLESIKNKFKKLEECIEILEGIKKSPLSEFMKNKEKSGAAMHYLVIGTEVIIDIGQHILSEIFQKSGETYEEVILELGRVKVIAEKFAKENADMARFRNLLIHDYIKVDLNKVYNNLQKAPDIFRQFAKCFQEFLEKN